MTGYNYRVEKGRCLYRSEDGREFDAATTPILREGSGYEAFVDGQSFLVTAASDFEVEPVDRAMWEEWPL